MKKKNKYFFSKFIHNLGYNLKGKEIHPKELQLLTKEIKGKKKKKWLLVHYY